MNHQLKNQRHRRLLATVLEVGVTGAHACREQAEGFSMGARSFPMALRTDSVNRGSIISLFTLDSVVLARFAGFSVFRILKYSQGSFAESVLNSSPGRRAMVQGGYPTCASHFWISSNTAFFSGSSALSPGAPKDDFCHSV
jgi:hypothetical protein